jgi:hypothetical protein
MNSADVWDDLRGVRDLDATLREGFRKEFMSRLGRAEPAFCSSCSRPFGFVSIGSSAALVCQDCSERFGGLPLPMPPNVTIWCAGCGAAPASIPREQAGKVIYYCDPCERKLQAAAGGVIPLQKVNSADERLLNLRRGKH